MLLALIDSIEVASNAGCASSCRKDMSVFKFVAFWLRYVVYSRIQSPSYYRQTNIIWVALIINYVMLKLKDMK